MSSKRPPSEPTELTLTINDLSRGGAGVARDESGRVLFVPKTAPGDRVRVRIVEEDNRFAQGELLEILEAWPERLAAPCAVFGRCGGCAWQHLSYERQWKTKMGGALHALSRVGITPTRIEEFPAERIWEYRNRIQLRGDSGELGFYAPRSHEIIPIDRCMIARPEINAELPALREESRRLSKPHKIEVEVLADGSIRKTWNAPHGAAGFRQVHDEQNQKLQRWLRALFEAETAETGLGILYDLFGGSGNLSHGLTDLVSQVHCVDVSAPEDRNASDQKTRFHRSSVASWIKRQKARNSSESAYAVLDPPRQGLADDFIEIEAGLKRLGVSTFVAVGCDPDAWARDISRFVKRGWQLERVAFFDFFPQTPHIESAALLRLPVHSR